MIKGEVMLVTPIKAKKYLERNKNNRPLRKKLVDFYADQMTRNLWELTGQGISISVNGDLLDGQHRMKAVIKSNKNVNFFMIFNIADDTFPVYDSGGVRTGTDIFSIEGIQNAAVVSSGINKYLTFKNGSLEYANRSRGRELFLTKKDFLEEYHLKENEWDELGKFTVQIYSKLRLYSTTLILGFSAYLIFEKVHEKRIVLSFFRELVGITPDQYSSTRLLREMLIKQAFTTKEMTPKSKFILLIKAWNYYVTKNNVRTLKHGDTENYPEIY